MAESARPAILKARDFAGRPLTLSAHPANWREVGHGDSNDILLLGLGPGDPTRLPFLPASARVHWLESPLLEPFLKAPAHWLKATDWRRLSQQCRIFFYTPGIKVDPDFWGPILGHIDSAVSGRQLRPATAWLPGNPSQLLHLDLRQGLGSLGYGRICEDLPNQTTPDALPDAWGSEVPEFVVSVNFRGLNSRIFYQLQALGATVAIWLVDNPWHILAGQKLPWWRDASLFVTDPSFIAPLKAAGARHVWHAPLAVSPSMWRPVCRGKGPPLFVGRSAFPDKEGFFRGAVPPEGLLEQARKMLQTGKGLPDYHWWQQHAPAPPWPGRDSRGFSLGAEETSRYNRAHWLKVLSSQEIEIIGDAGWKELLPDVSLRPPVDYYGALPSLYGAARHVYNITSLLLPHSLNQRHFDVWAAGGFLLTDYTPGLKLFPDELVREISAASPGELLEKAANLHANPGRKQDIQQAWREALKSHTYEDRLRRIRALATQSAPSASSLC